MQQGQCAPKLGEVKMAKRKIIDCPDSDDVKSITLKRKDSKNVNMTFSLTREDSGVSDSRKLCFPVDTKRLQDAAELSDLKEHNGVSLILNNDFVVKVNEAESGQLYFEINCEAMTEDFNISREILNEIGEYVKAL